MKMGHSGSLWCFNLRSNSSIWPPWSRRWQSMNHLIYHLNLNKSAEWRPLPVMNINYRQASSPLKSKKPQYKRKSLRFTWLTSLTRVSRWWSVESHWGIRNLSKMSRPSGATTDHRPGNLSRSNSTLFSPLKIGAVQTKITLSAYGFWIQVSARRG